MNPKMNTKTISKNISKKKIYTMTPILTDTLSIFFNNLFQMNIKNHKNELISFIFC